MLISAVPKIPFIHKKETIDFYTKVLGFTLKSEYDDYLILYCDDAEVHMFSFPDIVPAKSDFMIYLRVAKDIEQIYESLQSQQNTIKKLFGLESKPWGLKEFSVIDPNGTLLTYGQYIHEKNL